jgi:L-seryl-tRNA(Ser) seleniumtransferase
VRPIVNASGPLTRAGNAIPSDRVREAMDEAAGAFLLFADLERAAGQAIAELCGAEAGYVTSGAAAAVLLGVAAALARADGDAIRSLPHPTGPDEVLLFAGHRGFYDVAVRGAGGRLVDVAPPTADALDAAIGSRTAAIFYDATVPPYQAPGTAPALADVVAVGRRHEIPVIVDAALAIPPPGQLRALVASGADLVCFSGGKALQGPPGSGFAVGRADLVASIALQHQDVDVAAELAAPAPRPPRAPRFMGIGRVAKVGKEEVVGLVVALEEFLTADHTARFARWDAETAALARALAGRPGVVVHHERPPQPLAFVPHLQLELDPQLCGLDARAASAALLSGPPSIYCVVRNERLWFVPECLREGEAVLVADALTALLDANRR